MPKLTFEQYLAAVDRALIALCGMVRADIDDWRYADDYADGKTPTQCAKRAYRNAREACGM